MTRVRCLLLAVLLAASGCGGKTPREHAPAAAPPPAPAPTPDTTPVPALRTPAGLALKPETSPAAAEPSVSPAAPPAAKAAPGASRA